MRIMGTKIYLTGLGILLIVCLSIGFGLGYGHVFRPGADGVPDQDVAQVPVAHASSPVHKPAHGLTRQDGTAQAGNTPVLR